LVPLYIYKTADRFLEAMTQYVGRTLQEGLFGWQVTDCVVTMNECDYYVGDGPKKPSGSTSRTTAADFRKLTPLVLMRALQRAGTVVCEPMVRVSIETPSENFGAVVASLARLGGVVEPPSLRGELSTIEAAMPAARARGLQRQLPALTGGEGVVEINFGGYEPVSGAPPFRRRR
jgi:ribosomal protection tetracycline resistance protein